MCLYTNSVSTVLSAGANIAAMWTDKVSAVSYQPEKSGSEASWWCILPELFVFQWYWCNYLIGIRLFGSND